MNKDLKEQSQLYCEHNMGFCACDSIKRLLSPDVGLAKQSEAAIYAPVWMLCSWSGEASKAWSSSYFWPHHPNDILNRRSSSGVQWFCLMWQSPAKLLAHLESRALKIRADLFFCLFFFGNNIFAIFVATSEIRVDWQVFVCVDVC